MDPDSNVPPPAWNEILFWCVVTMNMQIYSLFAIREEEFIIISVIQFM
jgi:hypothetical protein